jgi:hypothetical protein
MMSSKPAMNSFALRLFVLLIALSTTLSTHTGSAFAGMADDDPAEIIFPAGNKVELPVGGKVTIRAYVLDKQGNRIRGRTLKWRLAKEDEEAFVYVGRSTEVDGVYTVELIWRPAPPALQPPGEVELLVSTGNVVAVVSIEYKKVAVEEYEITFDKNAVELQPGLSTPVKVTVKSKKDGRILDKVDISASVADEAAAKLVKVIGPDKDKNLTLIGLYGDIQTRPALNTAVVVRAAGAVATLQVTYHRDPVTTSWEILPAAIVGDNYGRTIKSDYYCVEVMVQNNSGSDVALAGLVFDLNGRTRPVTSYATVNGSLAKRKLTHPRALTLAIIDGVGSLMTGFNPFFHNASHAANYSQVIDIVSNPFAKGVASVWKDSYPDEVSRFQQDVLKDDKIVANGMTFKTKAFFPKRALFKNGDPDRENFEEVRRRLGQLVVIGYKLQGPAQNLSRTP